MPGDPVAALLLTLRSTHWSWTRTFADALSRRLRWVPVRPGSDRIEYQTPDGFPVTVYLLGSEVTGYEITLEAFDDTHLLSREAYEDKADEFYEKFRLTARTGEGVLGRPVFCDGSGAAGFPSDQDAWWVCVWKVNAARLMVEMRNEDRELPFRICVVVEPEANATRGSS